jgi:hypothetical protein
MLFNIAAARSQQATNAWWLLVVIGCWDCQYVGGSGSNEIGGHSAVNPLQLAGNTFGARGWVGGWVGEAY